MNMLSRRDFMKLSAAASLSLYSGNISALASPVKDQLAHSLLFDADALPRMRQLFQDDPRFAFLRESLISIDREAERRFLKSEVRYNDQLYDVMRLFRTAEKVAFLYLMTGDEDAADLAAEYVRTLLRFPRWDFYMETGGHVIGIQRASGSTISISLVSDWLGDRITNEERKEWFRVMGERGCEPCYLSLKCIRYPETTVGWYLDPESTYFEHRPGARTDLSRRPEITQTTNLRAIPACALAFGTVVISSFLGKSKDTERWMEMATHGLAAFRDIFSPDGSYHEGLSYANYTADHIASAVTLLERSGYTELGDIVNWQGYMDYVLQFSCPTINDPYGIVNFGDNGNPQSGEKGSVTRTAVPFWVARRNKNETAQWIGNHLTGDNNHWSLIWHDPAIREQAPKGGNQLWHSDLDWIVTRTGFTADDLVVAMRSGHPANHEHADRNSVIVKCYGEQLVTDPNRPPYSFSDPAWIMRLTQAHSAVLIDGRGHQYHNGVEGTNASNAHARIVHKKEGEDYALWISDATLAYRLVDTGIKSVARAVLVFYDAPALVIVDRVRTWYEPSSVQARFFGYNWDGHFKHRVMDKGFRMIRPGAELAAKIYCVNPVTVSAGKLDIPEERAQRHPYIEVDAEAAMETTLVTAMAIGKPEADKFKIDFHENSLGVEMHLKAERRNYKCLISADGAMPVIEVKQ